MPSPPLRPYPLQLFPPVGSPLSVILQETTFPLTPVPCCRLGYKRLIGSNTYERKDGYKRGKRGRCQTLLPIRQSCCPSKGELRSEDCLSAETASYRSGEACATIVQSLAGGHSENSMPVALQLRQIFKTLKVYSSQPWMTLFLKGVRGDHLHVMRSLLPNYFATIYTPENMCVNCICIIILYNGVQCTCFTTQWHHVDRLKLAILGVLIPWELENSTTQGLNYCFIESRVKRVVEKNVNTDYI